MADGQTDKGRALILGYAFDSTTIPTNFYLALCTSTTTPTRATDSLDELEEINAGNGYTSGGSALAAGSAFTVTESDGAGGIGAKVVADDVTFTAAGGPIPSSGSARWAVLLDGNSSTANVISYYDLSSDRSVSDTQFLKIKACEIDLNEPA